MFRKTEQVREEKQISDISFNKIILSYSKKVELSPIRINGNGDWQQLANSVQWCNGSGTWNDPYIIENVSINGNNKSICIIVKNSDVFFKIRACSFYNSYYQFYHCGIFLSNVSNCLLVDNNCSDNRHGILIESCKNITVKNNFLVNNHYSGIYIKGTTNSTVIENLISNNARGIEVIRMFIDYPSTFKRSKKIKVINNTLIKNHEYGITLNADDSTCNGNVVYDCGMGIYLRYCTFVKCSENLLIHCGFILDGSFAELSSYVIDINNIVNTKPVIFYLNKNHLEPNDFFNAGQVVLINCRNSRVSNLNVSYCSRGISLYYCQNISISNINASFNLDRGIVKMGRGFHLIDCNYITIRRSILFHNSYGIYSTNSDNCVISENIFTKNNYGIHPSKCHNLIFSNNTINYNDELGLYLMDSNNCIISNNTADFNRDGLWLGGCSNSNITKNRANYNDFYGIQVIGGDNNEISNNRANYNNIGGIELFSVDYSFLIENSACNNRLYGIELVYSEFNIILNNIACKNKYGLILRTFSNYNTIKSNNLIDNDICYIEDESCIGNSFINNNCDLDNKSQLIVLIIGLILLVEILLMVLYNTFSRRKVHKRESVLDNLKSSK